MEHKKHYRWNWKKFLANISFVLGMSALSVVSVFGFFGIQLF